MLFYFAYNVECCVIIIVASWLETIPCVFCNKVYLIEFGIKMKLSILLVLCVFIIVQQDRVGFPVSVEFKAEFEV
jgi:hypothetical protein